MPVIPTSRTRFLIEIAPDVDPAETTGEVRTAGASYRTARSGNEKARAAQGPAASRWLTATPVTTAPRANPWDLAHDLASQPATRSSPPVQFVEPDYLQRFVYEPPLEPAEMFRFGGGRACELGEPDPAWPFREEFAWHLGDEFSQLKSARELAGAPDGNRVRVGILDTGYDPAHSTLPVGLLPELGRDFFDDDLDSTDPGVGGFGDNPGHGTATLALLAGGRIEPHGVPGFDDFLGGAPRAEVVPIRIADSVIHFYSGSMAEGIEYAVAAGCRVVSISMGGAPTRRWAHAVNAAYEAGVAIFAAAGNNFGDGLPTRETVWPARFGRVVAVCGATADKGPYFKRGYLGMQGNFGPASKMQTAIAAYTPNAPWAEIGCGNVVSLRGGGTSCATPQAAAAAALWLQHQPTLPNVEPWQQVEAVRHALFTSADKSPRESSKFFGQGLIRAREALGTSFEASRPRTRKDHVWFPLLNLLTNFDRFSEARRRMLEVEAAQLAASSPEITEMLPDPDDPPEQLSIDDRRKIVEALRRHRSASYTLREFMAKARP